VFSRKGIPVSRRHAAAVLLFVTTLLMSGLVSPAQARSVPSKEQWLADTREAMHGSRSYVKQRVAQGGTRLAVNLDIDNTSLATYYAKGTAVPVVLRFARYARGQGVTLLFNTGRERGHLAGVTRTLRRVGYVVGEMCGRAPGESLAHSKQRCRRRFAAQGYTIIANVGNRSTDFIGGGYERAFRLPNYAGRLG
jgi:predicted secreted acid phosphatase